MQAVGRVDADGSRWLLADHLGSLSLLVLSHDGPRVLSLALEPLGTVSAPVTLTYLDSGVIYVGSCSGTCCPSCRPARPYYCVLCMPSIYDCTGSDSKRNLWVCISACI